MTDLFDLISVDTPKPLQGSAIFARNNTIRREIRRWWVPDPQRWVVWLMTNPSKAGATETDPTATRVTNFSRSWGYDGWIGVNLVPFVSSTMPEAWAWLQTNPIDDLTRNIDDIERALEGASMVMMAFGTQPRERCPEWLDRCLAAVCYGPYLHPHCLGVTQSGQPIHPLARGKHRVPDSAQPVLWMQSEV